MEPIEMTDMTPEPRGEDDGTFTHEPIESGSLGMLVCRTCRMVQGEMAWAVPWPCPTAERDALREALQGVLHAGQWLADNATDNGHAVTEHWGHSSSVARAALDGGTS
jgi:hypothetical protein